MPFCEVEFVAVVSHILFAQQGIRVSRPAAHLKRDGGSGLSRSTSHATSGGTTVPCFVSPESLHVLRSACNHNSSDDHQRQGADHEQPPSGSSSPVQALHSDRNR